MTATTERCQVVTTPADPPHIREVRCGRVLRSGWCPKHGQQEQNGSQRDGTP